MAKITPGEFIRQVRSEGIAKVAWPSARETRTTGIMVLIMTAILAIFFFIVDGAFTVVVHFLLNNLAG
ncbi:MAG: preprotein translocase subunit SecE [Sphingomicrobium sp.]